MTKLAALCSVALLSVAVEATAEIVKSRPADGAYTGPSSGDVLYYQLDDPSGSAFTDQAFEAAYAAYDSECADDFEVTFGGGWDISTVNTPGTVTVVGSNPFFVNHFFYDGSFGGEPGAVECSFPANTNFESAGDGDISTEVECLLEPGFHWVSQQVRLDYNPFGQHFWSTRSVANNDPAAFRNPGNGFQTGCVDWEQASSTCGMQGQDFLFELLGKEHFVTVVADCCPPVPALDGWGLALLVVVLGGSGAYVLRQRG